MGRRQGTETRRLNGTQVLVRLPATADSHTRGRPADESGCKPGSPGNRGRHDKGGNHGEQS